MLDPVLDARLPLAALEAIHEIHRTVPGCVHHSDRGTPHPARLYSAYIETFMKTLKCDEVHLLGYPVMADLSTALGKLFRLCTTSLAYIPLSATSRPQSTRRGGMSPARCKSSS
jgi:hypothetical protein